MLPVAAVALVAAPAALAFLQVAWLPDGQTIGWLAVGPLLASLAFGWRGTTAVGAYTVVVATALMEAQPSVSTAEDFVRLAVVVLLSVFAVVNCVVRERSQVKLLQITEVAQVAQDALVNPVPSRAGNWTFATRYRSSAEFAHVGGDLVEVVQTPFGVRAIIGDVRGKGLMIGIEFVKDRTTKERAVAARDAVAQACFYKGLLVLGAGKNAIRLSPSLVISKAQADRALGILDEAIGEVAARR